MDNDHTQRQNSTNASDDQDEKVHEEGGGEKLNHDGQLESNSLDGEPVDTEKVSVVQGKKKKTSVPAWRLVSICVPLSRALSISWSNFPLGLILYLACFYLQFEYANIMDILMITAGTLMAVAAGLGLPRHIILTGSILNQFVSHSLVITNNLTITAVDSLPVNETCATYQAQLCNNPQVLTNSISHARIIISYYRHIRIFLHQLKLWICRYRK